MNREMLEWGVRAVLPHVGLPVHKTDGVGLEFREGNLWAYAANRYTFAAARIPEGADIHVWLPVKEAQDLAKFVRPGRVAERTQELVYAERPLELHIGWDVLPDPRGDIEGDSAVFETAPEIPVRLDDVFDFVGKLYTQPVEWDELVINPGLLESFSKGQREEYDRLRIMPRRLDDRHGAAVVTIGDYFVGAIAGMEYDGAGPSIIDDLLESAA